MAIPPPAALAQTFFTYDQLSAASTCSCSRRPWPTWRWPWTSSGSSSGCGRTGRPATTPPGTWRRSRSPCPVRRAAAPHSATTGRCSIPTPPAGICGVQAAWPPRHSPPCTSTAPTTAAWRCHPDRHRALVLPGSVPAGIVGGRAFPPPRAARRGQRLWDSRLPRMPGALSRFECLRTSMSGEPRVRCGCHEPGLRRRGRRRHGGPAPGRRASRMLRQAAAAGTGPVRKAPGAGPGLGGPSPRTHSGCVRRRPGAGSGRPGGVPMRSSGRSCRQRRRPGFSPCSSWHRARERLIPRPRLFARHESVSQLLGGAPGQGSAGHRPGQHPGDIDVHNRPYARRRRRARHAPCTARCPGRPGGPRAAGTAPPCFSTIERARREVGGAAVVAEARPGTEDIAEAKRRRTRPGQGSGQEVAVGAHHAGCLGLLEHELAHEHRPRVPGGPPREAAVGRLGPVQDGPSNETQWRRLASRGQSQTSSP